MLLFLALLVGVLSVPIPGRPLLPPREVALVDSGGHATRTGIAVMLVATEDSAPLARRAVLSSSFLWNSWSVAPGWGFDGRAGDERQEQARSGAWFVTQRLLGRTVGVRVEGPGLPGRLKRGDIVVSVRGQAASIEGVLAELSPERVTGNLGGGPPPDPQQASEAPPYARLTVLRDSKVRVIRAERRPVANTVRYQEWTQERNPYSVPSLTDVSGGSAGLGLALGYISAEAGIDFSPVGRIAATGALLVRLDGTATVTEIIGLGDKIEASLSSGYDTLVVPMSQVRAAEGIVQGRGTVVGASSVEGALAALCQFGADCSGLPAGLLDAGSRDFTIVARGE